MLLANKIGAVIVFILGIVVGMAGLRFSLHSDFGPGPGFWPAWLSLAWIVLATLWFWEVNKKGENTPFYSSEKEFRSVTNILISFFIYLFLLKWTGFLLGTFIFLFYVLFIFEKQRLASSVICSACITGVLYLLFYTFLKVDLPQGFLGLY